MPQQSLINQRVIKAHMLSNGYLLHRVPITRDLIKSVNPFVPNAPFLYPPKTSENRKVF